MRIRPAVPRDAPAIAHVHVASWRTTYRDILPAEVLRDLSTERREAMWRAAIDAARRDPGRSGVWVVVDDEGRVVGFASGGREREEDAPFDGELYAIYLREDHQGRGIGRRLAAAVVDHLRAHGHASMRVWVLEGNPAQTFYERLGGERVGEKSLSIGGRDFTEFAYGWRDLASFG